MTTYTARLDTNQATARHLSDAFGESLEEQGVGVAAFEAPDGRWTVTLYFSDAPNETAVRALVALSAGAEVANALVFECIEATDWVAASLQGLAPVEAGRFLVHGRHDRARRRGTHIGIEIEAALAFGTGHHGTTRGCLLALDRILKRRGRYKRILDVGTGTGVLAIAAAKALRRQVLASDVDRISVRIARGNAQSNKVAPVVRIIHAGGLGAYQLKTTAPFDLVFANILLGPLQQLARPMARLLAPGAHVVLSGLLVSQANAALSAYRAQGLLLQRRIVLEGWTTFVLRRPPLPQ